MNNVYVIDGIRTPIGKTNGVLSGILPEKLAAILLNEIIMRNNIRKTDINKVILGNVVGIGGNIARLVLLEAEFPVSKPAITVDTQCSSALIAVEFATSLIEL